MRPRHYYLTPILRDHGVVLGRVSHLSVLGVALILSHLVRRETERRPVHVSAGGEVSRPGWRCLHTDPPRDPIGLLREARAVTSADPTGWRNSWRRLSMSVGSVPLDVLGLEASS